MTDLALRNTGSAAGRSRQRGFTLLELTVVIIVVALVIYAGMDHFQRTIREANATAVSMNGRALLDGVRAANIMYMTQGVSGVKYNLPRFANGDVDMNARGFPAGTSRQRGDRLTGRHCQEVWRAVTEANPDQLGPRAQDPFSATVAKQGKRSICNYAYRRDDRMYITYDPALGQVKIYADAN